MNKKDVIRIAKSIFLQQSISRQLFAKFNDFQDLENLETNFDRIAQNLFSAFFCFLGSKQRTPYPQIVQKNGMNFKIHKISIDGKTISDEIYKNKQFSLDEIFFELRKLSVKINQGQGNSYKQNIKKIADLWQNISITKFNSGITKRLQAITDLLDNIKVVLMDVNDFIVIDNPLIQKTINVQDKIYDIMDKQSAQQQIELCPIYDEQFSLVFDEIKNFINSKDNCFYALRMSTNGLKSFVTLYKQLQKQYEKQDDVDEKNKLESIINIMQTNNTNQSIKQFLRLNLKQYLQNVDYTKFDNQDLAISTFIRWIRNVFEGKNNNMIMWHYFHDALRFYQNSNISENAKQLLDELDQNAQQILDNVNNKNGNYQTNSKSLYSDDLSGNLIKRLRSVKNQIL